jgi:hypothetical protein
MELTRNNQGCIVGLVIKFVKGLQAIDINTLNISQGADGALTVVCHWYIVASVFEKRT